MSFRIFPPSFPSSPFLLAPTEPIAEAKIKTWELDAVVKGIKLRMEGKKRKRSARVDSESEDESDKSSSTGENESEAGTDSDATGDSNRTGDDDGPKGFVDEDDEVTSPPRKKIKLGIQQFVLDAISDRLLELFQIPKCRRRWPTTVPPLLNPPLLLLVPPTPRSRSILLVFYEIGIAFRPPLPTRRASPGPLIPSIPGSMRQAMHSR